MPIQASCPTCTKTYVLADSQAGKRVRCKHCADVFQVPTAAAADVPTLEPIDDAPAARPPALTAAPPPLPAVQPADEEVYNVSPADDEPPARPAPPRRPGPGRHAQPRAPRPDSGYRPPQAPSSPLVPIALLGSGLILTLLLLVGGVIAMSGAGGKGATPPDGKRVENPPPPNKDGAAPKDLNIFKDFGGPKDGQPKDAVKDGNPVVPPKDGIKPPPPVENFFRDPNDLDEALAFLKATGPVPPSGRRSLATERPGPGEPTRRTGQGPPTAAE